MNNLKRDKKRSSTLKDGASKAHVLLRYIGLAEVHPHPGNLELEGAVGAFVGVVGDAVNKREFFNLVCSEMSKLGFGVVRMTDVELLSLRRLHHSIPEDLNAAIDCLGEHQPIAFTTFDCYESEE